MKKTVTTQLGGFNFYFDEDAYGRLQHYLNSLRSYYGSSEEGRDIIADIELRMAEILHDKISRTRRSVSFADMQTVIAILGEVEQFADEPKQQSSSQQHYQSHTPNTTNMRTNRRLFRDPDDKTLGGVCSGIAAYVGLKPIVIRVAFAAVTLFYGASLLLYILLWIVLPEAKTTSEKLEMRGDPIDINNIERTIKSEFENLRKNAGF